MQAPAPRKLKTFHGCAIGKSFRFLRARGQVETDTNIYKVVILKHNYRKKSNTKTHGIDRI